MIKKLLKFYQKIRLGREFKHQYSCHPKFALNSTKDDYEVFWEKKFIARIKKAHKVLSPIHQSCYIVCSGPSIEKIDLSIIENADLIAVNGGVNKFISEKMIPTYIVIQDRRIFENQWNIVINSLNSGAKCFFSFEGISQICIKNPDLLTKHKNIFLLDSYVKKFNTPKLSLNDVMKYAIDDGVHINEINPLSISFSENLSKGLFFGKTVAFSATQLAYCLGYQNVFILGMDMGGGANKYFYNTKVSPTFEKYLNSHIIPAFRLANEVYTMNGRSLFNLSAKSRLPSNVLQKISFLESIKIAKRKVL